MSSARPDIRPVGILNFSSVNKVVRGRVGHEGATAADVTVPYRGKKIGGTDVGHMVTLDNSEYMVKTGISLSLLGNALKKFVSGDTKKERMFLSFIVGNFTRITGDKADKHPEIAAALKAKHGDISEKKFSDLLTEEMLETLNQFKTKEGQAILKKLNEKKALTTHDIYTIYFYLVTNNEMLRDVIGLASFSDLVNGAYGQFFNNVFQESLIPRDMLDEHHLLLEENDQPAMYMASRINAQAKPFHSFLLESFIKNKPENFASQEAWLTKCKEELATNITTMHGLMSALLIRLIMGESADLGPDNMLILKASNGEQYVINIDVTGFRLARRGNFQDRDVERLGWENILTSNNPADITNSLFNGTVFSNRFVQKFVEDAKDLGLKGLNEADKKAAIKAITNAITHAIVEVLKSKIDPSQAYAEVLNVRAWLNAQNVAGLSASLTSATNKAYNALNPSIKFNPRYLDILVKRNIGFISDSVEVSKSLQQDKVATPAAQ